MFPLMRERRERAGNGTRLVTRLPPIKVGMKLEARDRKYPSMICVATVTSVEGANLNRITINFDGWSHGYATLPAPHP